MHTIEFRNFGQDAHGRLVTHEDNRAIVFTRNPHGSHNLILIDLDRGEAYRHGDVAVLQQLDRERNERLVRKALQFLAKRGRRFQIA